MTLFGRKPVNSKDSVHKPLDTDVTGLNSPPPPSHAFGKTKKSAKTRGAAVQAAAMRGTK